MKKIIFIVMFALLLTGCSSSESIDDGSSITEEGSYMVKSGDVESSSEIGISDDAVTTDVKSLGLDFGGDYEVDITSEIERSNINSGMLTASVWDDIDHYGFYLNLFATNQDDYNIFHQYIDNAYINCLQLVEVSVNSLVKEIVGAKVEFLNSDNEVLFTAMSNSFGKAYVFVEDDLGSKLRISYNGVVKEVDYVYDEEDTKVEVLLDTEVEDSSMLEVMFVIDTTGSMSDELIYLQSEIEDVITRVSELYPFTTIRLALLFYKDEGDSYLTRYYDFTTDIEAQIDLLNDEFASGGGDFPEAVSIALDEAVNKQWSSGTSTKLLFHVLDAPPHDNDTAMTLYKDSLLTAASKGIRIFPIASSGIDKYTEFLLRGEALYTAGKYIYLTNDSGIGGDHIDASTGNAPVELLNDLLVRLIALEHSKEVIDIKEVVADEQE